MGKEYNDDSICKITSPVFCFCVDNPEFEKWNSLHQITMYIKMTKIPRCRVHRQKSKKTALL